MIRNDSKVHQKPPQKSRHRRPECPHHQEINNILKVFLVGIGYNFTNKLVHNFFSRRYKSILRVDLVKQKKRPKFCKGSGFMELTDPRDLHHILATEEFWIKGRAAMAKEYKKGKELKNFKKDVEKRRLFLHGLDPRLTDSEVRDYFSGMVEVENAYVVDNSKFEKNGVKKEEGYIVPKYGFITAKTVEGAEELLRRGCFQIGRFWAKVEPFNSAKKPQKNELEAEKCEDVENREGADQREERGSFRDHHQKIRSIEQNYKQELNSDPHQRNNFLDQFSGERYKNPKNKKEKNSLVYDRFQQSQDFDRYPPHHIQEESHYDEGYHKESRRLQKQAGEPNRVSHLPKINQKNGQDNSINLSSNHGLNQGGGFSSRIIVEKKKKKLKKTKSKPNDQQKEHNMLISNLEAVDSQFTPPNNPEHQKFSREPPNVVQATNQDTTGFRQFQNTLETSRANFERSFQGYTHQPAYYHQRRYPEYQNMDQRTTEPRINHKSHKISLN